MSTPIVNSLPVVLLIAACTALVGCRQEPDAPASSTDTRPDRTHRLVSLAPALTQILVDMGLEKFIVGVAEHDLAAPAGLPVIGHWQDIHTEALLALKPTHVLTMTGRQQAVPEHLQRLASTHGFELIAYPSPLSISEISKIILDDQEPNGHQDIRSPRCLGTVLDATGVALQTTLRMSLQLAHVNRVTADVPPASVLLIIGTNPLMASGPGTVHDQLLSFCGGRNAAEDARVGAPVFDKEKLLHAQPDVILLLLPGAPPLGPLDADPRLAALHGLSIPAIQRGRVVLINDPLVQLPSSSIARIATAMAKAIHPELADAIDRQWQSDPSLGTDASLSTVGSR